MPSSRVAPAPKVEIIYRVQDIPDNRNFNINIGRIRVDSGAESDEMVSLSDFTSCLVKKLGCLCGKTAVLA